MNWFQYGFVAFFCLAALFSLYYAWRTRRRHIQSSRDLIFVEALAKMSTDISVIARSCAALSKALEANTAQIRNFNTALRTLSSQLDQSQRNVMSQLSIISTQISQKRGL